MSARSRSMPWWLGGVDRPSIRGVTAETMEAGTARSRDRARRLMAEIAARRLSVPTMTNADPTASVRPFGELL